MQIDGFDPLRSLRELPLIQPNTDNRQRTTPKATTKQCDISWIQLSNPEITLMSKRSGCLIIPTNSNRQKNKHK
jgi:hypothetical protein